MRAWVSRLRKGIATSPTERERKRNQAVSPHGRFTLVTFWSLGSITRFGYVRAASALPRKRHSSRRHGMSQTCHNQKFATAISSSQFVQAPQTERPKENPP